MKKKLLTSIFICVVMAVAGAAIAAPGTAAPGLRQALQIDALIQERAGPRPACPSNFGGTITGQGDSALLGRVVLISTDCITPQGELFNFQNGHLVLMTANGDQIFANYSGQFVPTGDGLNYVFSGASFQITGGSGRYARASGGGTLLGGENMATSLGTLKLSGNISYPGSTSCSLADNVSARPPGC